MILKSISAILLFVILLLPTRALASSNFSTSYNIIYSVTETGITHAKLQGTLINSSSESYATSYKIQLGLDDISNVKASDSEGTIKPQVTKNDDGYMVMLDFNSKVVGNGSKLPFTITFDSSTLAQKVGVIWEINIPGVAKPEDFSVFTVNVVVPESFGKPIFVKPRINDHDLTFTKEQLGNSGISISFGKEQLYSFSLKYHIKNDSIFPAYKKIAIPPPTNYQDVFITQMSPPPLNVQEDADGNWLAEYKLNPTEKKDIEVVGTARINLIPKQETLSSEEFASYLNEKKYWEVSNSEIKDLARKLETPRNIYNYVVNTLNYDFSRVTDGKTRLGALKTLKQPDSAVCLEFTDLFITLARAAGIPAREINGFAYTENSKQRPLSLVRDILHSWPEYYDLDRKAWIMVDPTWESTTGGVDYFDVLDFDHLAFVVKGKDSNHPIPAGGYKFFDSKDSKDVHVGFIDNMPNNKADATVSTEFPEVLIAGLPINGKLTLKNTGTVKIKPQSFMIISDTLKPNKQIIEISKDIPPFGYQTWDVKFNSTGLLTNADYSFKIQFTKDSDLENKYGETKISVAPFYLTLWGIGGLTIGILIIILLIITFKVRRLRLFR